MKYIAIKLFQLILISIFMYIPIISIILIRKYNLCTEKGDSAGIIITSIFSMIGIIVMFIKSFEKEK